MGNTCKAYCWANDVPNGQSVDKLCLEELNQKVIKSSQNPPSAFGVYNPPENPLENQANALQMSKFSAKSANKDKSRFSSDGGQSPLRRNIFGPKYSLEIPPAEKSSRMESSPRNKIIHFNFTFFLY